MLTTIMLATPATLIALVDFRSPGFKEVQATARSDDYYRKYPTSFVSTTCQRRLPDVP